MTVNKWEVYMGLAQRSWWAIKQNFSFKVWASWKHRGCCIRASVGFFVSGLYNKQPAAVLMQRLTLCTHFYFFVMICYKNKVGQLLQWGLGDSMSWESTDLPEEPADGPNQWQEGCQSSVGAESARGGAGNRGWQFQSDVHGCGHLFLRRQHH